MPHPLPKPPPAQLPAPLPSRLPSRLPCRLYTCPPEWEAALLGELTRVFPASTHAVRGKGWLESQLTDDDAARPAALAFVHQTYDQPVPLEAASINAFVKAIGIQVIDGLKGHEGPWRLHISCVDYPGGPVGILRCQRIEAGLLEHLQERQRRLIRTRLTIPGQPWHPEEVTVQVALETNTSAWISILRPEARTRLRRCLSAFAGGLIPLDDDPKPPSAAYKKVVEAMMLSGRAIKKGERCVDLGGCPGGWSFVALQRGAMVTAVDRSPLHEDLMAHKRLTFVEGDAFKFAPATPVDWLLCDVIAFPTKSIALIDHWLSQGWCKNLIVTLKFKGSDDYPLLETCKAMLERHGGDYLIRRLNVNRNEVTVCSTSR